MGSGEWVGQSTESERLESDFWWVSGCSSSVIEVGVRVRVW